MDRLEAMVHIEQYGDPEPCTACGHTVPSAACDAKPAEGDGLPCPLLVMLQAHDVEDDVKAIAARIREEWAAEGRV